MTMPEVAPNFDEINAHVEKALASPAFQRPGQIQGLAGAAVPAAAPKVTLATVCAVYQGVKPMLMGLAWIPFIPKPWKKALVVFQETLDGICSG